MSYPQEFTGIVECCGVCGSDHHFANGNWGDLPKPVIVGHEIIGKDVKVGPKCINDLKVGDRVGVGAQAFSYLKCDRCLNSNEQYCEKRVWTVSTPYEDGYISEGGFANYVRVHEHFAIPIPELLESASAAPLLCGGITVYSPLLRNGAGPGKKVGIMDIGSIGHMGIMFAKVMGAEVYAISRSNAKKEEAFELGADHFIATKEEADWAQKYKDTFDLVVICAGSLTDIDFDVLPGTMQIGGNIISIAAPDGSQKIVLNPMGLMGISIGNSAVGSRDEIVKLLKFVSEHNIKAWVETVPISEEGVGEVFKRMDSGDVRYRFTLVDYNKQFK